MIKLIVIKEKRGNIQVIRKVLSVVMIIVIAIWFVINIFSAMNLSFMGLRIFRIASGSMEPYLKINDLILIKTVNNYKVGDVVTFYDEEAYTTHRIIDIDQDKITTQGDNNNSKDPSITRDKIIGKMIYRFEVLSFTSYLFSNPGSWGILFIIGVIVIVAMPDKKPRGRHAV